jgi:hypothetical protein
MFNVIKIKIAPPLPIWDERRGERLSWIFRT